MSYICLYMQYIVLFLNILKSPVFLREIALKVNPLRKLICSIMHYGDLYVFSMFMNTIYSNNSYFNIFSLLARDSTEGQSNAIIEI